MERLEERVVLSTLNWSGADALASPANNNWSDPNNWQEHQAPASGDTLVFPTGPTGAAKTSNDDISGGSFADLTIADSGYTITGSTGVTLTLSGAIDASQTSGSSTISPPVTLTASPGTITVDNTAAGLVMGGAVTAANGLAKQGSGVLDLKGTNTITGTTTVTAGALLVDGSVGAVAVDSGATIGGAGTVGSIITTAGTVSPGDSSTLTGILTDTGPLTLTGSSNFDITINGNAVGSQYDQVSAAGAVDLTGATLHVNVGAFNPTVGQQYTILHNTSGSKVTGTFNGLAENGTLTANGINFSITYNGTTSNPNDVILTVTAPPTVTWSGADASASPANNNWSDDGNWVGGHHPVAGDTIIFPSSVNGVPVTGPALTSTDDLANTIFNSIQVQASGYVINGANNVVLGLAGTIDASQATGTSTISVPIAFNPGVGTTTVDNSGATLLLTGTVGAPNGLTKAGQGTLGLEANNGSLKAVVNGGTLQVDGTAGNISVNTGATLSGTGTVAEVATTHATVSPGVNAAGVPTTGTLTDTGSLVLASSSTFAAQLNGTTAGSGYDQLVAGGTGSVINLTGATLSITLGTSFPTTTGDKYTILHNTSGSAVVGTFAGLAEGAQLTVSNKQFSISYKGGTNGQDVVLTSLIASTTTVSPVPTGLVSGQSVTLTATVTPASGTGTPTGTVDFKSGTTDLGTATLSGGTATLTTTKLTAGTNSITATYSGDTTYGSSTSSAVSAVVGQASSTTTVSASPNPSVNGQPVTLTALVSAVAPGSGTPTGSVTFFNGTTNLGTANLAVGVATLVTTALPTGTDAITAKYTGGTNFIASTSNPFNVVVNQGSAAVSITASDTNPFALVPITLTAIVSAASGSGTPAGTVTFQTASGTTLGTATLSSGTATLTTGTIPLGAQSILAVYSGSSTFSAVTSPPLAVTIGHPNDLYVNQVYQDVFGIPAGLGATYWIALLNGGYPPKVVARRILKSPGAKAAAVESVYESLLGRPATSRELKRALASGATSTTPLSIHVFGSSEFFVTQGHGTNAGFLTALAKDWFGAPFPAFVQSRLLRQLDRGVSRTKVARGIVTSPFGVSAQVNSIIEAVLERPATKKDQKRFAPLVRQGNMVEVYSTLFASKEFKALVKAQ